MRSRSSEATRRPREDRVVVGNKPAGHLVLTLRAGGTGTARSLALSGAAAMENLGRGLPGFIGAVFMTSHDDTLLLELMEWTNEAMLAAATGDHRYADHRNILRMHSKTFQRVALSGTAIGAPISFERAEKVAAKGFQLTADDFVELIRNSEDEAGRAGMVLLAGSNSGPVSSVIVMAKDPKDLPYPPGERDGTWWDGQFDVVEVVSGDHFAAQRTANYRLLPISGEGEDSIGRRGHV